MPTCYTVWCSPGLVSKWFHLNASVWVALAGLAWCTSWVGLVPRLQNPLLFMDHHNHHTAATMVQLISMQKLYCPAWTTTSTILLPTSCSLQPQHMWSFVNCVWLHEGKQNTWRLFSITLTTLLLSGISSCVTRNSIICECVQADRRHRPGMEGWTWVIIWY